jgi:thiamine-phosphate pyrophosphorylase
VNDRLQRLRGACLYLVCDEHPNSFLEAALRGGVDIVQLRMKDARDDRSLVQTARRFARVCTRHGALLILNDRPDLVREAGADGAHVGQDDTPVPEARRLVGPERIVGLSTHSPEQIDAATEARPDYIGVGPVHATPTKPGRAAVGLELVRYAAEHASLPFFAIGGIDISGADAVREAGGSRIAVVRALTESPDPESTARALREPTARALRESTAPALREPAARAPRESTAPAPRESTARAPRDGPAREVRVGPT